MRVLPGVRGQTRRKVPLRGVLLLAALSIVGTGFSPIGASADTTDPSSAEVTGSSWLGPSPVAASAGVPKVPAQQPTVRMECHAGATDINHATVESLEDAVRVQAPTAERIAAARPYLQPTDLAAVPGVDPTRLAAAIETGRLCATPLTLPPPAPDVCAPEQVDVNDPADLSALEALFGAPTAERIVAARPYPSLANTVRVPGVGTGRLDRLDGRLCATPVPVDHDGVGWAWVYTATGGDNHYSDFALTVGSGIIDEGAGAWTSIAPLQADGDQPGGRRADLHIHAPWADGDDIVWVELPGDSFVTPPGWRPIIRHTHASGLVTFISGDGLSEGQSGSVTAPVTSLSVVQVVDQPAMAVFYLDREIVSGEYVKRQLADDQSRLNDVSYNRNCTPDISDARPYIRVSADPAGLVSGIGAGQRAPAAYCIEGSLRADSVTAKLQNETGLVFNLSAGFSSDEKITFIGKPDLSGVDSVSAFYYRTLGRSDSGSTRLSAPGMQFKFDVPVDPLGNEIRLSYNPTQTAAAFMVRRIGDAAELVGAAQSLVECAKLKLGIDDDVLGGLRSCAKTDTSNNPVAREKVKAMDRILSLLEVGTDLSEAIRQVSPVVSTGSVYVTYARQLSPTQTPGGGLVHPTCTYTTPDGRTGYDEDCQRSFERSLVDPGSPPDSSGCWRYDELAASWVLDAPGGDQRCLDIRSGPSTGGPGPDGTYYNSGRVFCGVGPCVTLPTAAGKIVELTNGRSYYLEGDGSAWHLASIDAYASCGGYDARLYNDAWHSYKWSESALSRFTIRGDRFSC